MKAFIASCKSVYRILRTTFSSSVMVIGMLLLYGAIDSAILTVFWPEVIPKMFPKAVEMGYIAKSVDFATVLLAYIALVIARPVNISSIFKKEK